MKKTFIPKGTVERHENIFVDELTVKGQLIVTGIIRAKKIYGDGIIIANRINANVVIADSLEVKYLCAKKVITNKIFCDSANVSVGIIAKDYIEASCIKTQRLTTSLSQIEKIESREIVHLSNKRSFITTLFCSWLQERFMVWRHYRSTKAVAEAPITEESPKDPSDIEFESMMKDYREKYRKGGYRLVLEATEQEAV